MLLVRSFALFGLFSCLSSLALAQTPTAEVTGRVTDQTGAVVIGARLTVIGSDTGVKREATSNDQGNYTVPLLSPGNYQITVMKEGFRPINRSGITLNVGQAARLDFSLDVGSVTETVEITGEAPQLDTESGSLGGVVQNRQVVNMPLNNRNTVTLAFLVPGVSPSRGFGDGYVISPASFSVNGGRTNSSEVLTDGVAATAPEANPNQVIPILPQVDAIQEFKVHTNSLSAEFGRTGGGVLNFIFKSGTNQLHGSFFEFLRDSSLDANNFFNNRAGVPLASFSRHQYGGTLGGPFIRDKLFYFASFEGLRQSTGTTSTLTVPTAAERAGDFSRTFRTSGGTCQPVSIYDPFSTTSVAGAFVRTQFPNNAIPTSAIDPVARGVAGMYPLPTNAGDACSAANNFISSDVATSMINQPTGKVDFNASAKDRIYARLSTKGDRSRGADAVKNIATPTTGRTTKAVNGAFSYTRVVSATLIGEVRSGVARFTNVMIPPTGENFDMRAGLGWTGGAGNFINQLTGPLGYPRVTPSGYSALGTGNQPWSNEAGNSYQWAGSLTKLTGAQTLKVGVDFRVLQYSGPNGFNASGSFTFAPDFTQGPNPTRAGATVGNSLASLLTGMGNGSAQIIPRLFTSNYYTGLYLQDDYRVSKQLTLNFGLRYDLENGRADRYDHLSYFDFTVRSPLASLVPSLPNLHGGLKFVNADGNPKRQFDTDKNNFGPRFGVAYTLDSNTVIRAGYALYYEPYSGRAVGSGAGYTGFSALTTWISSLDGITPLNRFANPFPNGLIPAPGSSLGLSTSVGESLGSSGRDGAFDRTARVSYVQQWNFSVQRKLPANMVVELAYTGAKGTRLTDGGSFEEDQLPTSAMALGNQLLQSVPNPFFGVIKSGPLAAATTTAGQLLRPFPQFTQVRNFRPNAASSIYHAFQASLQKRLSHGVQFSVAYTNGKALDDSSSPTTAGAGSGVHQDFYNRHADRSLSLQDIAQRVVISSVVDLPFGRGRAFGAGWNRLTDAVLGGWQVNGIAVFESGLPFLLANSSDNSNAFGGGQRPNVSGTSPALPTDRSLQDRLAKWFDTSVFSQPAAFTFGNAPRVLPNVRGDGINNVDVSFFKNIALAKEGRVSAQFRAEFFNFLNTPEFSPPGGTFGTGGFGVVAGQQNNPRQVQFGLKVLF